MNRGMVMELKGETAVVLTADGQFARIRTAGRDVRIGQEIAWSAGDVAPSTHGVPAVRKRRAARIGAYAAAVMVLVVAAVLWSFRDPVVVAYVSMDVNPSIEMGLDSQERVRELRAVNADALTLIEGVSYQREPVEQVAGLLARKMADSDLLKRDAGSIVIASVRLAEVDDQWEARVTDKIKTALEQAATATGGDPAAEDAAAKTEPALTIETVFLPVEVREVAEEQGISSGKMAFYLAAEQNGHKVNLQALQSTSVTDIAASMGGLKQVMGGDEKAKKDLVAWKKMLADAKRHDKQLQTDKRKTDKGNPPAANSNKGANGGKNDGKGKGDSVVTGNGVKNTNEKDGRGPNKGNGMGREKDDKRKDGDVERDKLDRDGRYPDKVRDEDKGDGRQNGRNNGNNNGKGNNNGISDRDKSDDWRPGNNDVDWGKSVNQRRGNENDDKGKSGDQRRANENDDKGKSGDQRHGNENDDKGKSNDQRRGNENDDKGKSNDQRRGNENDDKGKSNDQRRGTDSGKRDDGKGNRGDDRKPGERGSANGGDPNRVRGSD